MPELDLEGAYLTGIDERDPSRVENYWFHPDLVRGFAYTLISAQWLGDEMSYSFRLTEPWDDWCAAQEPVRGGATVRTDPTDPNVIQIVRSPVGEAMSYLRRE